MNVAIVGGGASAHLLGVLLARRGHDVRILTSRPQDWSTDLELETDDGVLRANISGVSSHPEIVLDKAKVAFLCCPVHQYPSALRKLLPGLVKNPDCIVGPVYGQGGYDWMVRDFCRKHSIPIFRHFAIGLLPWIARTLEYGHRAISYGPKFRNGIACSDSATFDFLKSNVLDDLSFNYWGCGRFEHVPNFLTLTLTVDNQIIHPSRCFALAQEHPYWSGKEEVPFFYKDFDKFSTDILCGVDEDYTTVRRAFFKKFPQFDNPFNLSYLELEHWSYGSHNPDIQASFVNSNTLSAIMPPVVQSSDGKWRLDINHRFFKDDFAFGLEIAQWFGSELGVALPHVD